MRYLRDGKREITPSVMANQIPSLVAELKKHNTELGDYQSNIINENRNHVVRFSNGILEVPSDFYERYKFAPSLIPAEEYAKLAGHFLKYEY